MWVENNSWPCRMARSIRRSIDNWTEAYEILFPPKPEPKPEFLALPDNVIRLVPLSERIQRYVRHQEQLDGSRPTCREVARVFDCAPSTVSRSLAKAK